MLSNIFPMSKTEAKSQFDRLRIQLQEQNQAMLQLREILTSIVRCEEKQDISILKLQSQVKECMDSFLALQVQLCEVLEFKAEQQEVNSGIISRLDSICAAIFNKEQPCDVRFEREYYKDFPTAPSEKYPSFQNDFLALVTILVIESIETIVLALK